MNKKNATRKVQHVVREDARCPLCGHRWHDCQCAPEVLDDYVEHTVAEATAREVKRDQRRAKLARLATRRGCDRALRDRQLADSGQKLTVSVSGVEPELLDGYVRLSGIMLDIEDIYNRDYNRDAAVAHA